MEYVEFTGKTTEAAIRGAEKHFEMSINRLEVEVVSAGSSGFMGLFGGKKAVVKARPLTDQTQEQVAEVMRELTGEPKPTPKTPRAAGKDVEVAGNERTYNRRKPEEGARQQGETDPEVINSAMEVAQRLVGSLDNDSKVTAEGGSYGIRVNIEGGETGIIIGRRGQTLDALQYLVTRIVSHQEGRPVRINVDAGGYRRRRRESLESLARRMADKAKVIGRPVSVGPFNSPERRVVHMALKGRQGVSTASRGRGELKKVVIAPRN